MPGRSVSKGELPVIIKVAQPMLTKAVWVCTCTGSSWKSFESMTEGFAQMCPDQQVSQQAATFCACCMWKAQ